MLERIIIAGTGGQGIVALGKLVAKVALSTHAHVTFIPSYGAEVRGGTSNCQIIISAEEIASPVAESFDSLLLMNQPSTARFLPAVEPGGLAVLNTSLCTLEQPGPARIGVPATEIAIGLGNIKVANVVMLGRWMAAKPVLERAAVEAQIRAIFPDSAANLRAINLQALAAGYDHR